MSDRKDSTAKPFSAFEYESPNDPDTVSLSDSDPESADEAEVTSLSPGEEEEEEDDEDDTRRGEEQKEQKSSVLPFTLKGGNAGFSRRSHDIFGGLLDVQKSSPLVHQNRKREVADTLSDDDKEEIADSVGGGVEAAPVKPTSKGSTSVKTLGPTGRVPDYLKHPERWTKYSLENVPDTSDRTNRNTALNFLTELKHQKEAAQEVPKEASVCSYNQDSSSSGEGRILFSRPTKKVQQSSDKRGLPAGSLGMSEALTEEGQEESEEVPGERAGAETLGFHGVKKRARKNIRPKKILEEEADSS